MNRDEIQALSEHLKCLGTKAVRLDRYLQRRAWGVYYSIWAVSILLFTFLSYPISLIRGAYLQLAAYVIAYVLIVLFASYFSGLVFSKARRLANLESDLSDHQDRNIKKKCGIGTLVLAVLIVAIIIIGSDLLRTAIGVLLEVIILALIDLYVYRMLVKSLGKIPFEGLMAVSVFMFSDVGSAATVFIYRSPEYFGYLWIPTIFAWFIASIYSIYHARDELVVQIDSQECN
jgi:hypothetical protein